MKACKHVRIPGLGFGGVIRRGKRIIIRVCDKCGEVFADKRPVTARPTREGTDVLVGRGVRA